MIKLMTELERRYWTWLEENDPGEVYSLDQIFYPIYEEYPHCKDDAKATLAALADRDYGKELPALVMFDHQNGVYYQMVTEDLDFWQL